MTTGVEGGYYRSESNEDYSTLKLGKLTQGYGADKTSGPIKPTVTPPKYTVTVPSPGGAQEATIKPSDQLSPP